MSKVVLKGKPSIPPEALELMSSNIVRIRDGEWQDLALDRICPSILEWVLIHLWLCMLCLIKPTTSTSRSSRK